MSELLGEQLVELQERIAERRRRGRRLRERPLDLRLQLAVDVAGACRRRLPRRAAITCFGRSDEGSSSLQSFADFERQRPLPRRDADLGRAARERRVLGLARGLVVGARGERRLAALQRDVADQQAVHQVGAEPRPESDAGAGAGRVDWPGGAAPGTASDCASDGRRRRRGWRRPSRPRSRAAGGSA